MKRKFIPPFLMLLAGAISGIIMLILHYETKTMLIILLAVLIGFYAAGILLMGMLNQFDKQNEKLSAEEGEELTEEEAPAEEGQVGS